MAPGRVAGLDFGDGVAKLAPGESVVLAVPPWVAGELVPGFETPKLSVSAVLGDAGVGLGVLSATVMPGKNPTVTSTEPLTAA